MFHPYERTLCAQSLFRHILTDRERDLVTAFALGYSQSDVSRSWGVSISAVSHMTARIYQKAINYWTRS